MLNNTEFKLPSLIPQDLQLIQDLVSDFANSTNKEVATTSTVRSQEDDSIMSSDEEDASSEKEVEADILGKPDDEEEPSPSSASSGTSDDESTSDSDSEEEANARPTSRRAQEQEAALDDDDEAGSGAVVSPDQVRTKNEVAELNVVIPEVEEVELHEVMEKVGEIVGIIDKVVIVKGVASQVVNRASERALDSDTLLVFGDRKVLGYIWETFGPTSQPFYRVQFNEAYPLDPSKVQVSREVFHIPARSNFVFVSQLKLLRGSDASNANDEEPADDELEFSDDEQEREHKRSLKEKRGGSEPPSRHATPNPSHMRDLDMAEDLYGENPYDAAYNDMDFGAGPSRPPPVPYDDPYSDYYGLPESPTSPTPPVSPSPSSQAEQLPESTRQAQTERSRGRGRGKMATQDGGRRDRGRGRGQDRRRGDRGRGRGRGRGSGYSSEHWNGRQPTEEHEPRTNGSMSPTSMAIARATGQFPNGTNFAQNAAYPPTPQQPVADQNWAYQQYANPYDFGYGYQQSYVQPHINPRFASMFGMGLGFPQQQGAYGSETNHTNSSWGNDWTNQSGTHQPQNDGSQG